MWKAVGGVAREFEGVSLGDKRLDARAMKIAEKLATMPDESFPEQMGSDAELEALYRFVSNDNVTLDGLLAPHVAATAARIRGRKSVRIVHDTSAFRFNGDREGLGILRGKVKGFLTHVSLAIAADETREPLGVVAVTPFINVDAEKNRGLTRSERVTASNKKPRSERKSSRWENQAIVAAAQMPEGTHAIHVMDQEADDFAAQAAMIEAGIDFVVRGDSGRLTIDRIAAKDVLAKQPATALRTVHVTERPEYKNRTKNHPVRAERAAKLELRWGTIVLKRAQHADSATRELSLNAVHVFEPNPPPGEMAIEWMLFTSVPIETKADAEAIVDHYRARWIIEEYFKALKTGCAIEKRQLTSYDGLTTAFGLFVPLAWHLLLLRHVARAEPKRPGTTIFDADQLLLLRALLQRKKYALPSDPTAGDVMLAIAKLGGHIKNNGEPGWLVLGRGYIKFTDAEVGWNLARTSDQS